MKAIVIDNGSETIKSGISGDKEPSSVVINAVGRKDYKYKEFPQTLTGVGPDRYIGNDALSRAAILNIIYPIERGIITNWHEMTALWHHIFLDGIREYPNEYPVILTESSNNTKTNRELMAEIMFEQFSVPLLYIANQDVLSLYSSGRTTGVVVNIGHGLTQIAPIIDNNLIAQATKCIDFGGIDLTKWLQKKFEEHGKKEIFNDINNFKEKFCYVALDYEKEIQNAKSSSYSIDGDTITLADEIFSCPESLFKPQMCGCNYDGINKILLDSIMKCNTNSRDDLYKNIVISGGSSMFNGFKERFEKELNMNTQKSTNIQVYEHPNKKNAAWIGGSILASHESFSKIAISKTDFEEYGTQLIH